MSVDSLSWKLVAECMRIIHRSLPATRPIHTLSLGYTDYMISRDDVASQFGEELASRVAIRNNIDDIARFYGTATQSVETRSLYEALGMRTDFVDVAEIRGGEIVQDLNQPFPSSFRNAYDLVIDSGTLEHCFNVGQAIVNVADALKVGGIVHHGNPLVMINHGFYNFSPQFYFEFYLANGFEILEMFVVEVTADRLQLERVDPIASFSLRSAANRTIQVIARKVRDAQIIWPTQTKYRMNPRQIRPAGAN